jgi:hypothetical protein
VQLRVGVAQVELAQHDLAVRPRQLEDAVGEVAILVLVDQALGQLAAFGDAGDDVDHGRLLRLEGDRAADGHDRVEHRALAVGQRPAARIACVDPRCWRCGR